ncbi:tRNA epoxyqueuosine(34) reductase QueG [Chthonobacter albigriseus]|uniref:tRNA epoxyqueuosine(34) reductase QueG n=1 Tax=Chthonobacter albigriseus TaxID=1683161 RepID=UPI0031404149
MPAAVAERARSLGFDVIRVTSPDAVVEAGLRLRAFVADGLHGEMSWMADTLDRRADPRVLWPAVRSVVMLGLNYGPSADPLANLGRPAVGNLSVYARNRDYHDVLKGRLKEIAGLLARETGAAVKVFVDTAPLMEKPLAAAAGLGWQGKHTNLVSRDFGSWLFLGAILTDAELAPDAPETDHCGSCRACLDACPTDAFPAPYRLDARRCISYLTIEHAGPIPAEFRAAMGNRIYGCDDCLAVCPWNKFAAVSREAKLAARPDLEAPRLADLAGLDDVAFRALFSGSPVKRIGRSRFLRNVLVAIGNSADPSLAPAAEERLADPDPLVRGAAVWALSRLDPGRLTAARRAAETDPDVRAEWDAAAAAGALFLS